MSNTDVYQPSVDLNGGVDPANYGFAPAATAAVELDEQPGSSKSGANAAPPKANGQQNKLVMDYGTDFPKLPEAKAAAAPTGAWGRRTLTMPVVTKVFTLPAEVRGCMVKGAKAFGHVEQSRCSEVAQMTNTKIELSEASDKSLTILISGDKMDVESAHADILRVLQTQVQMEVTIPKEFYGAIIGKEGSRRYQLEAEFFCRIYVPGRDEHSEVVRVIGPADHVKACVEKLNDIVSVLAKQATETLEIPRDIYPWIRGPFGETVEAIQNETAVRVNIPGSRSKNQTIVITGEREGVSKAVAQVKQIYENCKKNNKGITCKVSRAQHRFIVGRAGIDEILKQTGVVVDVPPEEDQSDIVSLRGPQDKLGDALALVFARASSIISLEIKYPEWQRRFLIGPKGATLQQLVPKQDRLNVDFENGGIIYLEGPPEAVKSAHVALSTEIARLTQEMASESVKVPAYLHRHIIGRNGALINKIKEDHNVQITIPDERKMSDEIKVEGNKDGVKNAIKVLKERAAELEKKMPADKQPPVLPPDEVFKVSLDVDPKHHKHFVLRGAEVIREIQDQFAGVIISFPRQDSTDTKVQIKGPKASIDLAKKRIEEIVADLEAQITVNLDIPEEYHRSLVVHANDLRAKHNVRLRFPPKGTSNEGAELTEGILPANLVQISGKQPNVDQAKAELFELIPITEKLIVPVEHHSLLIGKKGETIRAVMQQFKVRINIPPADQQSEEITVAGPPKEVQAALADLSAKVAELEKAAEDRRARTFKTTLEVPLEFHQRLIGTGGAAVRDFSKKFDVHVAFPRDQTETIIITGYEAKAEAAKQEIERLVERYRNMVSMNLQLDPRFHARLIGQRGRNLKKLQEEYDVEVNFASRSDPDPSLVTVSGVEEEKVLDCLDKLRGLEEDYMQDVVERHQYEYRRPAEPKQKPVRQEVQITGAPWQLDNLEQFPSMGEATVSSQPTGVWGRPR